jgi:hypothetical protein
MLIFTIGTCFKSILEMKACFGRQPFLAFSTGTVRRSHAFSSYTSLTLPLARPCERLLSQPLASQCSAERLRSAQARFSHADTPPNLVPKVRPKAMCSVRAAADWLGVSHKQSEGSTHADTRTVYRGGGALTERQGTGEAKDRRRDIGGGEQRGVV